MEWILLGEDNSYLYFSEGYFTDDGEREYEYEFSKKITPNFAISNVGKESLLLDGKEVRYNEENQVEASALYGENSKVYTVGEKVVLGEFDYK